VIYKNRFTKKVKPFPAKPLRSIKNIIACIILALSFVVSFPSVNAFAIETYSFVSMWPSLTGPWYFTAPQGVATDSSGNVYIADTSNNRVFKFNSSGVLIKEWGSYGTGDGQFNSPRDLAVDSSMNTYVVDTANNRIQKFDSTGTFVSKWGSNGTGNGQFNTPQGIVVDSSDYIYVADSTNNRIQKFDADGTYQTEWGTAGTGDGQFNSPQAVAVDSSDNIFVADTNNNRIQKFDADGNYQSEFGSYGTGDGLLRNPRGIGIDASGYIYISDTTNNRVQKFDSSGTFVTKWGATGAYDGMFNAPYKLAVSSSGYVYVADVTNNRIQKFDTSGGFVEKWACTGPDDGMFYNPYKLAVGPNRCVYVTDTSNNRIEEFSSSGAYIGKWGSYGMGNGQFYSPQGIAIDTSGNVYIADTYNHRIQKFDASGNYLLKFGSYGTGNGLLNYPQGVAVDSSGNIYVADTSNNRIQKFDASGTYVAQWGSYGSVTGKFNAPRGIAIDSSDNVYVVDTSNNRIQKFDDDGVFLTYWGGTGAGNGQFNGPRGIAVDTDDNIYVADMTNNRIQKFDSDGWCLTKWGTVGFDNGCLRNPQGIAVDAYGNAYVADTGNHRIQRFSSESVSPTTSVTTNPASANGENGWFTTQPTVTLSANEPGITFFHWDNDTDTTYTVPFVVPCGEHILAYHSKDEIGNVEVEQNTNFYVDSTNPVVANTIPVNGATDISASETITVTFSETVTAGPSYNLISANTPSGTPINIKKTISANTLLFNILSETGSRSTLVFNIPAGGITDRAGNALTQACEFSFTTAAKGSVGGGGGGGGSSIGENIEDNLIEEKLVKNVKLDGNTVAELSNVARVGIPGDSIYGDAASINIRKYDGDALKVEAPLLSGITEITLDNGTLQGSMVLSLNYDKYVPADNRHPAICLIADSSNNLQPIGGLVDNKNGVVSAIVTKLGRFAVIATNSNRVDLKETYKDMTSHWAEETVGKLAGMDILTGYTDNTFKPDSALTRAEIAVIMARALKIDTKTNTELIFEDNHDIPLWARGSIACLLNNALITGVTSKDGIGVIFDPNRPVTRAEFAAIIRRAIKMKTGVDLQLKDPDFTDNAEIPAWSRDAVNIVASMNIINGYPGNKFNADNHTSRAETATMISRMLELLEGSNS
jgi:tripartite motif-containing protein 71